MDGAALADVERREEPRYDGRDDRGQDFVAEAQ